MKTPTDTGKKVLVVYFSFSSQTNNLVQALCSGLEKEGVSVVRERLLPVRPLRFPIGSIGGTLRMMIETFLRKRLPIEPVSSSCFNHYDLIVLAGPTWSYNPSGPILALFDRDGERLFRGKKVLPLISCRGYWRMHWWGLKSLLRGCGARVVNVMVFSHPNSEPWRTIGVFLKLAGRIPEKKSWFASKYRKYGHTTKQVKEARRFGQMIGSELVQGGENLQQLDFDTAIARF
ncbi:MAG: flavodoxin family protein [Desulfobulbaceae bacterium]